MIPTEILSYRRSEIFNQTNPHQSDTDGDGLTDYNETIGDPYAVDGSTGTDQENLIQTGME